MANKNELRCPICLWTKSSEKFRTCAVCKQIICLTCSENNLYIICNSCEDKGLKPNKSKQKKK